MGPPLDQKDFEELVNDGVRDIADEVIISGLRGIKQVLRIYIWAAAKEGYERGLADKTSTETKERSPA